MSRYQDNNDFEHGRPTKVGVLVVNLGTPDAPTPAAVRRYLTEFLSDPRVVETPRWLWLPILHGVILRTRPKRSAAAYAKVWTADGSPLLSITREQTAALQTHFDAALPERILIKPAMRYGAPSIAVALRELRDANVRRVLVLPLYPQYAAATTASVFDALAAELRRWRWVPALRFVSEYHAEPGYIDALAASIREHWSLHERGERLLMSFHGIPRAYFLAGDPYYCQCHATARRLAAALELAPDDWQLTFQSRFGRRRWLEPYTDRVLVDLGRSGIGTVDVVCPGFAADCLETLEEIAIQNRDVFVAAGGRALRYIPALNARPAHIAFLGELISRHLRGWRECDADYDPSGAANERAEAAELAARARIGF